MGELLVITIIGTLTVAVSMFTVGYLYGGRSNRKQESTIYRLRAYMAEIAANPHGEHYSTYIAKAALDDSK
jgi:hypothetical protein